MLAIYDTTSIEITRLTNSKLVIF